MNFLFSILVFLSSGIALAEESVVDPLVELAPCFKDIPGLADFSDMPELLLKVLPFFLVLLLLFRALAAGLLLFAKKTETKADDKVAQAMTTAANLIAKGLSLVASVSMPKAVLMAKAEKIALKEMGSDKTKTPGVG